MSVPTPRDPVGNRYFGTGRFCGVAIVRECKAETSLDVQWMWLQKGNCQEDVVESNCQITRDIRSRVVQNKYLCGRVTAWQFIVCCVASLGTDTVPKGFDLMSDLRVGQISTISSLSS